MIKKIAGETFSRKSFPCTPSKSFLKKSFCSARIIRNFYDFQRDFLY